MLPADANNKTWRVIVDECAQGFPAAVARLERMLAPDRAALTYLSKDHKSIPDSEILAHLLAPDTVLLTRDCVLHNRACALGFRSFYLDDDGALRARRLGGVPVGTLPVASREAGLKADYSPLANPIATALKSGLTERDFKRYRTKRRRIRSYFSSQAHISSAALTIGARRTREYTICGFFLALAGHSGVKGIRASEGYGLVQDKAGWDPAWCVVHALRDVYLLQLETLAIELFIIPGDSLVLCQQLLGAPSPPSQPTSARAMHVLLNCIQKVRVTPCGKGRFYEAMESKLDQLAPPHSNELVPLRLSGLIAAINSLEDERLASAS